jgi:hypothetical protein
MNPPDWVKNEASWRKTCRRVVARCNDYLEGRMLLIDAAREITKYSFWLHSEGDSDFMFFRAVHSDTLDLPTGIFREGWATDSLAKKDQQVQEAENFYRAEAITTCKRLIQKYTIQA